MATAETSVYDDEGRWIRTGKEVCIKKAPSGNEHLFILDRIKESIKVKEHQVATVELEAHLLSHPVVGDCGVIRVSDKRAGEVPKAYVVTTPLAKERSEEEVVEEIHKFLWNHKANYKGLRGGIEFIDVIPKSPSSKIPRRMLRDLEEETQKHKRSRLRLRVLIVKVVRS